MEFALTASMVSVAMISTVDIGRYYYARSQVENATQMGAQSAWQACDVSKLPATINCPGFTDAVNAGIWSTSLGTGVNLQAGSPSEGYYCVNTSGDLQYVSDVASKPTDCSSVGSASDQPADYIKIQTSFSYTPIFTRFIIGNVFPSYITATSLMRMK